MKFLTDRTISVAYIAPSVTPFSNFNPGYKIYYVDGDHPDTSRMVIDEECWTFNLDDANMKGFKFVTVFFKQSHCSIMMLIQHIIRFVTATGITS